MADLVVSIIAGPLFEQVLRLAKAPARPALILEGTSRELAESGMSWEAIQGALVTVTLFCGIPLLRTRSPEETVSSMLFAARQGRALALGALPRGGYRPRGKHARQLYILQHHSRAARRTGTSLARVACRTGAHYTEAI